MKKKIVLFIPSIESGGVEKNLFLISEYLAKKNLPIYIITANTDYKNKFNKKIKVICPNSNKWVSKKRTTKTLIAIFLLIKNFYSKKTIILSFQSNLLAIISSKFLNSKIIIRLNTSIKKYINQYFSKLFYRFFYSLADEIVVNSIFFQKELKSELRLNSKLIYNSCKPTNSKKKLDYFKNYDGLKIINIGRLTDQKDQITLLKSLNLLAKNKVNFKCCIIGAGVQKNFLNNYIKLNNLNNFIKLIGYKKNAENYLSCSNLFILSSKFEGLPNVLIEAQSKNIPIISSDCPTGPREILLNGKLGDLFSVGNYKKLSKLIKKFKLNNKRLIKKSKLAKKNLMRFDLKTNCEKYLKIISKYQV